METTLSSKGQIVLPQRVRRKLALRPGTKFACRLTRGSIVLTPKTSPSGNARLVRDTATRLMVTKGTPGAPVVTSEQVRAALAEFP